VNKQLSLLMLVLFVATPLAAEDQSTPRPVTKPAAPATKKAALPSRVFISLNGGLQSSTLSFSDTRTDPWFGETASWTADYRVKSGPEFDLGGGVRVWRSLLAQVSYSRFEDSRVAVIAGQVPHPFFFNQPRAIGGESAALKQQEQAIHIAAVWTYTATKHLDVSVFGGPSVYVLKRDLVSDVTYADGYPYDSATFDHAAVANVSERGLGFHAGADVAWLFTKSVGVGAVIRFTRASLTLDSPADAGTVSLDLGGLQFGGGLRLRLGGTTAKHAVPPSKREPAKTLPVSPLPPTAHPPSSGPASPSKAAPPKAAPPEAAPTPAAPAAPTPAPATPVLVRNTTVLKVAAPVYIAPDVTRAALRLLPAGTSVKVREDAGDWLMVEFSDRQWGPRVGYVLKKNCEW
jgi:hypothetical protein